MAPASDGNGQTVDVAVIGSAIVDVLAPAPDELLSELGLVKGSMKLVTEEDSDRLYSAMGPAVEVSGGSAANTAVGVASLGGSSGYMARVAADTFGELFTHDLRAAGVSFRSPPSAAGPATGRCLIFVTPDAERTMCTYLGAASHIGPEYVDRELIESSKVVYLEGYLWDLEPAKEALRLACSIARGGATLVALSLSDPFCVERHREEFLDLVDAGVDLVFANEEEAKLLYEVATLDEALSHMSAQVATAAVTRGGRGSVAVRRGERVAVEAHPVGSVVDTTGAGDLYAAGFLVGVTRGHDVEACARLGSLAAAEAIGHMGPRPEAPLGELAERSGLSLQQR